LRPPNRVCPLRKRILSEIEWAKNAVSIDEPAVLDLFGFDAEDFMPGTVSAKTGAAGYRYVEKSIAAALAVKSPPWPPRR
jgi:hypothetical protein